MLTSQVELIRDTLDEMRPMFPEHHRELGLLQDKMPLDPQYDIYLKREALGEISLVTIRDLGKIVGYWISFIAPGLHYRSTLTATMDILYIHPDYRNAGAGRLLGVAVELELRRRGVKMWWAGTKCNATIAGFLTLLGMTKGEEYFYRWLGDE
jgi:GNAT superfamily N-acetyltransferase